MYSAHPGCKHSVNPLPAGYAQSTLAKFLRNGYSQISLMGMSCSWLVDFFPRPVVRPTLIQLAAL